MEEAGDSDCGGDQVRVDVSSDRALLVRGRSLTADDRRVLTAFARAAVASLERELLAERAAEAARLAAIDQLRTTLIAGVVLFTFGTGPVRGFAVTLCLGILTSLFTAILGSRAYIHLIWGRRRKLASLPI